MKTTKLLATMKNGEEGTIVDISSPARLARRLEAMGLRVGCRVVKTRAIFWRGPVAVRVGNTKIALARAIAEQITVAIS